MFRNLLPLLLALFTTTVLAVPAKRERCTLRLADGTAIEATWMGDEWMHFYQTDDGRCLQCSPDGTAYFVSNDSIHNVWHAKARKRQAARTKRHISSRRKAKAAMTGNKHGLVILVEFPDAPFHFQKHAFQHLFNEEGYFDDINIGSVHDYFLDASYGQFSFTFDVIGPIMLKDSLYHYGRNNLNGDDIHPALMVSEAVKLADEQVDYSIYDWNNDGKVEQVFIIHSGHDEAQSRARDDIWSHAWALSEALEEGDGDGPVVADGVCIDSYATSAELRGKSGLNLTGIGTACHEFSHCFGLPDFYDTQGSNFGLYTWSLMDYGEYNGEGGNPAAFTSYERMFCGWLQPTELTSPQCIADMPALTSSPVAYIIRNSGKADEYYILENRQQEGWDACLPGHGMLVLHVDYDEEAWQTNTVNIIRSHRRMTLIPADGTLYSWTLEGDPWPGLSGATELSENSTPAATLYNTNAEGDKFMHHSITEITESTDGLISFIFDEEALGISQFHLFTISQPDNFTISSFESDAGVYDLGGRRLPNCKLSNGQIPRGIYITDGKKVLKR